MSLLSGLKHQLTKLAHASVTRMDDILIFGNIAGWMASSGAQIYGIAKNKDYSREQKKYMINQELFDALTNIGLYFGITKSLTAFSSKLVKTGKLAPRSVVNFMNKTGLINHRGKLGFDITQAKAFLADKNITGQFNAFKSFANVTAATIGGIISSNIVTPIVRNRIAAHRQNKFKQQTELAKTRMTNITTEQSTVVQKPATNTISPTFAGFRNHVLNI